VRSTTSIYRMYSTLRHGSYCASGCLTAAPLTFGINCSGCPFISRELSLHAGLQCLHQATPNYLCTSVNSRLHSAAHRVISRISCDVFNTGQLLLHLIVHRHVEVQLSVISIRMQQTSKTLEKCDQLTTY